MKRITKIFYKAVLLKIRLCFDKDDISFIFYCDKGIIILLIKMHEIFFKMRKQSLI